MVEAVLDTRSIGHSKYVLAVTVKLQRRLILQLLLIKGLLNFAAIEKLFHYKND